jgi:hypothetical protein
MMKKINLKKMGLIAVFVYIAAVMLISINVHAQITPVLEQSIEKNYVNNGGFESTTAGWKAYKDAAAAAPVDGTGGSPTTTITSSTSSPIAGKASGLFTHPASNTQGEGVAIPFTVEREARGKVLTISASYEILSGTYSGGTSSTDSDVVAYIYDVDAAQIIQPAGYKLDGGVQGIQYSIAATFQTNTTSTNYRLILHSATTTTSAFVLKIDSFKVSLQRKSIGPAITDWTTSTNTAAGTLIKAVTTNPTFGTIAINNLKYARNGQNMLIDWDFQQTTGGTAGSGLYLFDISALGSFSINTTLKPVDAGVSAVSTDIRSVVGHAYIQTGTSFYSCAAVVYSTTQIKFNCSLTASGNQAGVNFWSSSGIPFSGAVTANVRLIIPIQGWGSTVTMSDSADTRVVALKARATAATAPASDIVWQSVSRDTHGGLNAGKTGYVVQVPGDYQVSSSITLTYNTNGIAEYLVYVNGTLKEVIGRNKSYGAVENGIITGSTILENLKAGDQISLRFITLVNSVSMTGSSTDTATYGTLSINKVQGPSQIAASESITAEYNSTTGQSVANNVMTFLDFGTRETDSHAAVQGAGSGPVTTSGTGWRYVCPISGKYAVSATAGYAAPSVSNPGGAGTYIAIFKQGSQIQQGTRFDGISTGASGFFQHNVTGNVNCAAGERIEIGLIQNAGGVTRTLSTAANNVRFTINKVGN